MSLTVLEGDCRKTLQSLPDESVQCCVTSPPYWGLRNYARCQCIHVRVREESGIANVRRGGHALETHEPSEIHAKPTADPDCVICGGTGTNLAINESQIGQEKTPEEYIASIVQVFTEVRRVLKSDGTLWLNLGDSYANVGKWGGSTGGKHAPEIHAMGIGREKRDYGDLKGKDMVGIPWMAAFALRAAGWFLRCDIIWNKPNPMPESVTDRPTKSHEYIFLLSKSARYYYDHEAIKEPPSPDLIKQIEDGYKGTATKDFAASGVQDASATKSRIIDGYRKKIDKQRGHSRRHDGFNDRWDGLTRGEQMACGRNKRSVWTVAPANYPGAHFATYPPDLIKPCILAGTRPGDTVLDPFGGSGTSGQVSIELGRNAILCELNPEYIPLIDKRCFTTPGLALA